MVYLFLTKNCELVEAMTPLDLLRRADIDVKVISLEETLLVETSSKIAIQADELFDKDRINNISALIFPGGPGVPNYFLNEELKELTLKEYNKGTLIAAICAAPTYIEGIGIQVNGTVYPTYVDKITNYRQEKVCTNKNLITGEALGASIDFGLEIIRYLKDESTANRISNAICK